MDREQYGDVRGPLEVPGVLAQPVGVGVELDRLVHLPEPPRRLGLTLDDDRRAVGEGREGVVRRRPVASAA